MFSKCDLPQAEQNVASITGARAQSSNGWALVASYDYRDAEGKVLFQKRRYKHETEGKSFRVYRPNGRGWEMGIDSPGGERTKRVLYNLPALVTANLVCLAEGEKDCDTLNSLQLYPDSPHIQVSATCNFDGAWQPSQSPKWLEDYNPHFTGKGVFIFEDNDIPGRAWSEHIAASVYRYAAGVKIIRLPGLPEHGDVSDWMLSHTVEELRQEIKKTPRWKPETKPVVQRAFIDAEQFISTIPEEIEWWVDGVIQKGANGFIVAEPGAGKSFITADLVISLALGVPWLGRKVPQAIRVGYCAREDNPTLTSWRLKHLLMGKPRESNLSLFKENLWLNSRQQTAQMLLNDESQVQELICAIQDRQLQLVFLDVFNVLHTCDEDKAKEMAPVLENVRRIQREAGCAVGIVDHYNKRPDGSVTQRMRGTSAFGGFAEWVIGVEAAAPVSIPTLGGKAREMKGRRLSFEKVKAGEEYQPVNFVIDSSTEGIVRLLLTGEPEKTPLEKDNQRKRDAKANAA